VQEEFRQSRTMTEFSPLEDRLPPQNIEAEEAVLGGILMDSEALTRVAELLRPEAFYVSAHQDIYRAALLLNAQGLPTDLMSVTTYLEDNGFLEKVGGKSALRRLVESLVNTVNIDQYARLIADKYTRRQLIRGGQEVVALGYDTAQDITLTLDQAEQKIFAVTQERVTRSVVPASDILLDIFESLEQRFTEGAEIPGIASSFYDLDSLTQGFQPSDLIIVAGRPSMGKTSLCLSIGHNITQKANLPVVVFSLEMSKEQLVQRLLSSEAEIDSHRLRSGRISENEWQKVGTAIGRLASSPLFIDDTPNATVMEMRSKCRRLMAEQGGRLGMIIIDYLQLMEGSSDNRVQELSKITRGLKGLGRELKVPVMALSQLSRAVEARTNKRPMLSDLRESGCLTGDSLITMADSGIQVPIRDLVGKSGFAVWALDETTLKLNRATVSNAFSTGHKPVFRIKTRLGRTIRATGNHKFLTIRGWQRLDELQAGDRLALPRQIGSPTSQTMSDSESPSMQRTGMSQRKMQAGLEMAYCGTSLHKQNVSRDSAARIAQAVQSNDLLLLSASDIYWDGIIAIEPDGVEEVFDLTVPGLHNFIANNIVVHNSIEQDADLVMMVYRDEYYNADSPDRGIAEVILSKHRNGPTGTVKLLFEKQFARFKNLA
jgi:replicative DNA helicase